MDEIKIVDTTLRDGNTSLWAHNMTTGMMHPVLRHMDKAGFDAMEFFVAGRFKKVIREQLDNPWDWVRYGQKEIKNTQLRYHGGLTGGFILSPLCIPRLLLKLVIGYGINMTRLSDPWNDYDELKGEVEELKQMGMTSVVNLIYSISPRHTDEYYARKAREAAAMKPYRICFKDVAGMLTPDRAYTLAKLDSRKCRRRAGGVPLPLQQWLGAFQRTRSREGGNPHRSYLDTTARQRFGAAVGVQRRQQSARAGLPAAGQ